MIPDNSNEIKGTHPDFGYKYSELRDSLGRMRTNSLFWESRNASLQPLFTKKDYEITRDGVTYPSLKEVYLSYDHVPFFEYEFARDIFNSWSYWENLCLDGACSEMVKEWRQELEVRNNAKNIKSIMQQAQENVQAAKYLVDKGYEVKRAGRVSKEEIAREKKIMMEATDTLKADMERLGISVVAGGK